MHGPAGTEMKQLKLTKSAARDRVRALSVESGRTAKIVWTRHIQERMDQRGIDSDAVLRILRKGDITDDPCEGDIPGDWKVKVTLKMATGRVAGVLAVITRDDRVVLVTTEWEDYQ